MNRTRQGLVILLISFFTIIIFYQSGSGSVLKEGGKTYIIDREGHRWDVTQAITLGFNPGGFQYGIGKDTIVPLTDSLLKDNRGSSLFNFRIIGVEDGDFSQAYSVSTLSRHEIVNSHISGRAIAVGY